MTDKIVMAVLLSALCFQCKTPKTDDQVRKVSQIPAIEFHYWKLVTLDGKPVVTPPQGREVYMILTPNDRESGALKGHAGCNGLGGDYKIEGRSIKFQPITTRMYCDAQMEIENAFTRMLTATDNYRIHDRILELYHGDELLGKFETNADHGLYRSPK
jgi:heat shock protein HslJ